VNSFEVVANELIEKKSGEGRAAATIKKQRWLLQLLGQDFRKRPVADVTPQESLHELKKHERRGRLDTTKQLRAFAGIRALDMGRRSDELGEAWMEAWKRGPT
jgi:hypothetical protein